MQFDRPIEQLGDQFVLQVSVTVIIPVVIGEIIRTVDRFPQVRSSSDDSIAVFESPRALNVKSVFSDGTVFEHGYSAKVQNSHVSSTASK